MRADKKSPLAKLNKHAVVPATKTFEVNLGQFSLEPSTDQSTEPSMGSELASKVNEFLKTESEKAVRRVYQEVLAGGISSFGLMPLESFLPLFLLKQLGSASRTHSITPEFIEFGFDLDPFYSKGRPSFPQKRSLLKAINTEFSRQEEGEEPFACQLIIDENAVNSFLLDFILYEKAFSLREVMKTDSIYKTYVEQLNTSNLAMVLPEMFEAYPEGLDVDFYLSMSHTQY